MKVILLLILLLTSVFSVEAQKNRARDLGIPFAGETGRYNAITDVQGVEVGYSTIISDQDVVLSRIIMK